MAVGRLSWMMTLRKMGSTCEVSWRITAITMDAQMCVICSTSSWMVSAKGFMMWLASIRYGRPREFQAHIPHLAAYRG